MLFYRIQILVEMCLPSPASDPYSVEDTVRKEILEETGLKNVTQIQPIDYVSHGLFYHITKHVNRLAHYHLVLARLEDLEQQEISEEDLNFYNRGYLEEKFNLSIIKGPVEYGENLPYFIKRIKRTYPDYQKENSGYDDSKYFDKDDNPLEDIIYEVKPDEELVLYNNGDIEIRKRTSKRWGES